MGGRRFQMMLSGILALLLIATVSVAESATLGDSRWTLTGSAVAGIAGYGSVPAKGPAYVTVSGSSLSVSDGIGIFSGTFSQGSKGYTFTIAPGDMEESIWNMLGDIQPSLQRYITDINVRSIAAQLKVTQKAGTITGISVAIQSKINFRVVVPAQGLDKVFKLSYSMSASGGHSDLRDGQAWLVDAKTALILGTQKYSDDKSMELLLGPFAEENLDYNQFALYDLSGGERSLMWQGDYIQTGTSFALIPFEIDGWNDPDIWDWRYNWLNGFVTATVAAGDSSVQVSAPYSKSTISSTAKLKTGKAGETIGITSKASFDCVISSYSGSVKTQRKNGTYTLTGTGVRAD